MKKNCNTQRLLLKLMRFSFTQLFLLALSATIILANDVRSQEILNRHISIKFENENPKIVLQTIEKVADVSFSYRKGLLHKERKITLDVQNEALSNVLNRIFKPVGIEYEVIGQQIVLMRSKKMSQAPPSVPQPNLAVLVSSVAEKPVVINITGVVIDENNEPLVGASIIVKGTTIGTITDVDGKFSLSVQDEKAVLVIQFIGYQSKEVVVGTQTLISVRLDVNDKTLNEVVVVGYGTANRKDILGAVGSVKDKDIEQITPVNTFDAMQGRLAGVQISSNGGPGSGSDIRIRGTSTFSGGVRILTMFVR
jgi:TonB-dependent starch-binding outer membrane protein SusC